MRKFIDIASSIFHDEPDTSLSHGQSNELYQTAYEAVNIAEFRDGYGYDIAHDDSPLSREEILSSLQHYTEKLFRDCSWSLYDAEYTDGSEALANQLLPEVCDELSKAGFNIAS